MKTVYFIRHGQTYSNHTEVTGRSTDPLSDLGMEQAERIANRFRTIHLDTVISSPYVRAFQTAEVIAATKNLPITTSNLFIEIKSPSEVEGKAKDDPEVAGIRAQRWQNWGNPDWHFSDEENFFDSHARAQKSLHFLEEQPGEAIAVATHGAFIRALLEAALFGEQLTAELTSLLYPRLLVHNTGIMVMHYDQGKWQLIHWNDTGHLDVDQHTH